MLIATSMGQLWQSRPPGGTAPSEVSAARAAAPRPRRHQAVGVEKVRLGEQQPAEVLEHGDEGIVESEPILGAIG
jgi:hypothetical protein